MKRAIAAFALVVAVAGGYPPGTAFAATLFGPEGACRAVVVEDLAVLAVRCEPQALARVAIWLGPPGEAGSRLLVVRLEEVGQGFALPVAAGVIAAARRGEIVVEVAGVGLAPLSWKGLAGVELLPFLCGFETGTACGIWSFVLAVETCDGTDEDCDAVIDDGTLCDDGNACTNDSCAGAAGCQHLSACAPGATCCLDGCAFLSSDPQHCGTCTTVCAFPHADPSCVGAMCGIASCQAGWGNCDGQVPNGCETNTTSSAQHCSGCNIVCPAGANGSPLCMSSVCALACNTGWANCSGGLPDGCETNTTNNALNCGGCGYVCASYPHASPACLSSICAITCTTGWANCDNNIANGCEVDITTNVHHCGSCYHACPAGNFCAGGICIVG